MAYSDPTYIATFKTAGNLCHINNNFAGVMLERSIPNTKFTDLCSIYPFHSSTATDLVAYKKDKKIYKELKDKGIISMVLVSNPLKDIVSSHLGFNDLENVSGFDTICPFKTHFIIDLNKSLILPQNHRRNIRKASEEIEVKNVILTPSNIEEYSDKFADVYSVLAERHNITGLPNFSRWQLANQLRVKGTILLEALKEGKTCGFLLFYLEENNAYYHLGCYTEEGYKVCASYALMDSAIKFFKQIGINTILLGGSSGSGSEDGLYRFKQGWANSSKQNYLLFKIINPEIYKELSKEKSGNYLPLYRS